MEIKDSRAQEMLVAAAEGARERLRSDREKASPELRRYLEHIDEHLFEVGYDPAALRRAFGIPLRSRKLYKVFRRELNCGVKEYLMERRLETAKRLLLDTDLKIWRISLLVGYLHQSPFQKTFKYQFGETPRDFRKRGQRQRAPAEPPAAVEEAISARRWRAAVAGCLPMEAAREWIARLEARYPGAAAEPRSPCEPGSEGRRKVTIRGTADADLFAGAIWETLRVLPHTDQRRLVREQVAFETPALFHLLLEKSRQEGREDRQRRLELAELALESLEGSAEALGEELSKYRAQGWAWVGNARRLVGDILGAEDGFSFAEAEWGAVGEDNDSQIRAELYVLKADLRMFQRRLSEAADLNENAMKVGRLQPNKALLIRSLILQAAISQRAGDSESNIRHLREAVCLIDEERDPRLAVVLYNNLINSYVAIGAHEAADSMRPKAKELCRVYGGKPEWSHLLWIEGRQKVAEGNAGVAEKLLLEAHAGLVKFGAEMQAALVGMDLAALYLGQHRSEEALNLTLEAVPVFEGLKLTREALAALKLLGDAVGGNHVSENTVNALRESLDLENIGFHPMEAFAFDHHFKEGPGR